MSSERLASLLRAVDALVLPSTDEGIPLVIQEVASAGVAILTTERPGYDHYFEPDNLWFVERDGASIRTALRARSACAAARHRCDARRLRRRLDGDRPER